MTEEVKTKGMIPPNDFELAQNMDQYEIKINELVLAPRIEVFKDGKLVRVLENAHQKRTTGTINPEYVDALIADLISDFRIGFKEVINQQAKKMADRTRNIYLVVQ